MTSASSLAFPGSRTLAGWWRQLALFHPHSFGVGHFFLHRVEAPVCLLRARKPEPVWVNLLQALERELTPKSEEAADLLGRLENRLHLGRQIIFQLLRSLEKEGLVGGDIQASFALTSKGQNALHQGEYLNEVFERRVFYFLEIWDAAGARLHPPCFVPWEINMGQAWQPGEAYPFDVSLLHRCLQQDENWKSQFGFPREVRAILDLAGPEKAEGGPDVLAWQRIIVVRPERFLCVWAVVPRSDRDLSLLFFPARQDGWVLQTAKPALQMTEGWHELFPEAAAGPSRERLEQTWLGWAKSKGLPDDLAAASSVELVAHHLQVQAPPSLIDQLRLSKSDVFKGDTWLLIGEGHVRPAALLKVG